MKKKIFGCACIFAASLTALYLLLTLSAAIPNGAISRNMIKSAESYSDLKPFEPGKSGTLGSVSDNYADCVLLGVAYNMGNGNPFVSSVNTGYYDGEKYGEAAGVYLAATENVAANTEYTRYWHGMAMLVRPLHAIMSVKGIKALGFTAVMILFLAACGILCKHKNYKTLAAYVLSVLSVHIWNVGRSMEYQAAFVIGFAVCIAFLVADRRVDGTSFCFSVIAMLGGTLTAFFDFLTTETVSILLPLALVTCVRAEENRLGEFRKNIGWYAKCGLGWLCGYAGAYAAKWTLASLLTGENKFTAAVADAAFRFNGNDPEGVLEGNAFHKAICAQAANLSALFGGKDRLEVGVIITGIVAVIFVGATVLYVKRIHRSDKAPILLVLLSLPVFVRFALLSNHSYMHAFFTYRALITVTLSFFFVLLMKNNTEKTSKRRGKNG